MTKYSKQYSYPIEIHNSIQQMGKEDLRIENQFKTYRQMLEDSVISGSVSFIKSVLNRPFYLKPHIRSTKKEREVVEALNKSLKNLEPYNFNRTMNNILTLVEYGTSLQEVTFERKNGYQVFKTLSPISLQSVNKYVYDRGELKKLILNAPENDGMIQNVAKAPKEVDGSKVLAFQFQADPDNPLGKSLLRGCYSTWKEKTTYRELGLVGASKSLAGVMKVEVPSEYLNSYFSDPSSDQALLVDNLIKQSELMGQGRSSFVCLPSDTTEGNAKLFDVQPIKGVDRQGFEIEASINRCNRELFQCLQASVLSLGQDDSGSGSYGLSSTKNVLLENFLRGVHSTIASEFMKAIKLAFQLNGLTDERLPEVEFEDISEPSFEEFVEGMKAVGMSGLIEPTGELDRWIKERINAPTQGGVGDSISQRLREEYNDDTT
ncbi:MULTISPECIES: phage portal protein family protein [Halomonadaceae]|uniref:phage portal protein family protein n=1 Tax=Halomonadaceae TaxID=28256 RepID=UPI00158180AC|nr:MULTISPECIES: hypothetical protein [Halomonas]MDI4637507.1 hypothetical protein [Halomonas sp. BMC7]NUJ61341.1 hypothetical protein [Halomonas taeanensis]